MIKISQLLKEKLKSDERLERMFGAYILKEMILLGERLYGLTGDKELEQSILSLTNTLEKYEVDKKTNHL